ncbi:DEAD/DEAH box helicase [Anthocerotibacter panamensis]|uniref:DEAD/DEAH box helicase n=1 Tax=Anthocerotibacter panamensis TaxID=2857077 RepID=UPI001C4014C7|nr:DEAD/DEAH box helicase [Anthocerotibacter panamensis]
MSLQLNSEDPVFGPTTLTVLGVPRLLVRRVETGLVFGLVAAKRCLEFTLRQAHVPSCLAVLVGMEAHMSQEQGRAIFRMEHREEGIYLEISYGGPKSTLGVVLTPADAQAMVEPLGSADPKYGYKQTLVNLAKLSRPPEVVPEPLPSWLKTGAIVMLQDKVQAHVLHVLQDTVILQRGPDTVTLNAVRARLADGYLTLPTTEVRAITQWLEEVREPRFRRFLQHMGERLSHIEVTPAQPAQFVALLEDIHPAVAQALRYQEIPYFYSHQVAALEHIRAHRNLILTTPTSSGKTLSFLPGVTERILTTDQTVLCLYPLKALQTDQQLEQRLFIQGLPEQVRFVTGNISRDIQGQERLSILNDPQLRILNLNPDVLHWLLLHIQKVAYGGFRNFLSRLGVVVLDEAHAYVGSFGAKVAALIRRLHLAVQTCAGDPDRLQYILASATVGNPATMAQRLTGREFQLIDKSGAKRGERTFAALKSSETLIPDAASVGLQWLNLGLTGIIFVNTRKLGQAITGRIFQELHQQGKATWTAQVAFFKSGLLLQERLNIQERLKSGQLRLIVSTSSLEAGINIPALDACLIAGYPGSVMSLRQRAGRCGRTGPGLVVFLPGRGNPLDEYFARAPEQLFTRAPEAVHFNYTFPTILGSHLLCAATESRLAPEQVSTFFGKAAVPILEHLLATGALALGPKGLLYARQSAHGEIAFRGGSGETYRVRGENGEPMEELQAIHAYREAHPGAIYRVLKGGKESCYVVQRLDPATREIFLQPTPSTYTTTIPITDFTILPENRLAQRVWKLPDGAGIRFRLYFGTVRQQVVGYRYQDGRTQSEEVRFETPLPPIELLTPVLAVDINEAMHHFLEEYLQTNQSGITRALHTLEHLVSAAVSLHVLCARQDVDGVTLAHHTELRAGGFFLFDTAVGGTGVSEAIYETPRPFLESGYTLAAECDCTEGCPSCCLNPKCTDFNQSLDKALGLKLLGYILAQDWQELERAD